MEDSKFVKAIKTNQFKRLSLGGKTKVAIMGFAPSWKSTPFDDSEFEIWTLNEAYKLFAGIKNGRAERWFEIHSRNSPSKNTPEHIEWLKNCPVPVYMWEHYEDMPNSIAFPKDYLVDLFDTRYFTNSISWMIAFAIAEGFTDIHVYGVDMAQNSEYQMQRPSCEYFLGVCAGLGINYYIPPDADLLKASQLYGFETDNAMRLKMKSRLKELKERRKQYEAEAQQAENKIQACRDAVNQIAGAIEDLNYLLANWSV